MISSTAFMVSSTAFMVSSTAFMVSPTAFIFNFKEFNLGMNIKQLYSRLIVKQKHK
jgi:hypothetical protein